MKIAAYIPIKLNNERAPGKNIKKFSDGTPLCDLMFKTISEVEEIDEIYCFCSSKEIEPYLTGRVKFLQRDSILDGNQATFQDICNSFIQKVDADIVILAHVTSPFLSRETIKKCVDAVKSGNYDSAFTACKIQDFLWKDNKPLNFNPQKIVRTQDLPPIYKESYGCYAFSREMYEKIKRRIGNNPYICEISKFEEIDIDYPEDFEIANSVYMYLKKKDELNEVN